jgi:hypothetical protein
MVTVSGRGKSARFMMKTAMTMIGVGSEVVADVQAILAEQVCVSITSSREPRLFHALVDAVAHAIYDQG